MKIVIKKIQPVYYLAVGEGPSEGEEVEDAGYPTYREAQKALKRYLNTEEGRKRMER